MTVVVAIIATLAALTIPAVTGVTTDTRTTTKSGDLKQVDTAVTRFESDSPGAFPISGTARTDSVTDADADDIIKIAIESGGALDVSGLIVEDVICGDDNGASNLLDALRECFGKVDFGQLVPDPLKNFPEHANPGADALVTAPVDNATTGIGDGTATTSDLTIPFCNITGDTCEIFLDDSGDSLLTDMVVWNVDKNLQVFVIKEGSQYGK